MKAESCSNRESKGQGRLPRRPTRLHKALPQDVGHRNPGGVVLARGANKKPARASPRRPRGAGHRARDLKQGRTPPRSRCRSARQTREAPPVPLPRLRRAPLQRDAAGGPPDHRRRRALLDEAGFLDVETGGHGEVHARGRPELLVPPDDHGEVLRAGEARQLSRA